MKEVEPYDLMFENHLRPKKKCSKNNLITHFYQQVDERVPYEIFASQLKKLNDEQKVIVDDILYKKKKSIKTITRFLNMRCKNKKNAYINVHHIKHVTMLY
jgi:hypothetical protein